LIGIVFKPIPRNISIAIQLNFVNFGVQLANLGQEVRGNAVTAAVTFTDNRCNAWDSCVYDSGPGHHWTKAASFKPCGFFSSVRNDNMTHECLQKGGTTDAAFPLESCKNDSGDDIRKILFQTSCYPKGNKAIDVRC
jgi:hypothetical protein